MRTVNQALRPSLLVAGSAGLLPLMLVLMFLGALGSGSGGSIAQAQADFPALVWEAKEGKSCQSLKIAASGVATFGPCQAAGTQRALNAGQFASASLWNHWLKRFAPLQTETSWGRVTFRGQGTELASPAWGRAIASWAKLAYQELESGRSGASWGTALSWDHRSSSGECQFLQVEIYGRAQAGSGPCQGGVQAFGEAWLETQEMEALDRWFYGKAPVFAEGLKLFAMGKEVMSPAEVGELRRWTSDVFARVLARRNGE